MSDFEVNKKAIYKEITLKNKNYLINENLYLDIVLSDYCNVNCQFCVGETKEKKQVLKFDKQSKNFIKYSIERLGVKEVLLVGGEPTISNNLFDYLDYLNQFDLDKICLTTNGIRLLSDDEFCEKLFSSALTHLNISIMNLNSDKRKEIAQTNKSLNINRIKNIKKIAIKHGVNVRINNNIFLNNNDNLADIVEFYNFFKDHVDSIKFSPLLKTTGFKTTSSVTNFNDKHCLSKVKYDELFDSIENCFKKFNIITNEETFGFVKYSMIESDTPIVLNWNHRNNAKLSMAKNKINSVKLLSNNTLSLDWHKQINENTLLA